MALSRRPGLRLRTEGGVQSGKTRLQTEPAHARRTGAVREMGGSLPRGETHHQGSDPSALCGDGFPACCPTARQPRTGHRQAHLHVRQFRPGSSNQGGLGFLFFVRRIA